MAGNIVTTSNITIHTKMKNIKVILFVLLAASALNMFSQDEQTWKEAIIFEFSEPYEEMTISFDDEEFIFQINSNTEFLITKKKSIPKKDIFLGSTIDVSFIIENRNRVLTEVMVSRDEYSDEKKINGVFESFQGRIGYVDGRKIQLISDAAIACDTSKDCNCSKGRTFLDFEEIPLGSFLTVTGKADANGTYLASKIEVCKNIYTANDQQLMTELAKNFDATNLRKVGKVPSAFNSVNSLHNGKIKVGNLEYRLVDDIRVQGYINMIGNRLLPDYVKEESFTEENNVSFRFYVIESDVPNAFAFPNGMIFMHTGLLKLMENEAQIAAVLGHEIAHVTNEHGAKRFKTSKITSSGAAQKASRWVKNAFKKKANVASGSLLDGALDTALEYTTPENVMNLFNKKDETQSDRVGMYYMSQAGYDPREAANFWQIMMANTKDQKFMNKIFNSTLNMVNTMDDELDEINFDTLGKDGTDILVKTLLETVYTSHPLSVKRYGDINRLLSTIYESTDYTQMEIGKAAFGKYLNGLK